MKTTISKIFLLLLLFLNPVSVISAKTIVGIQGDQFTINGKLTYEGRYWNGYRIEGLLMNARLVQGIFDNLKKENDSLFAYPDTKQWDAERNNKEFVRTMCIWHSYGLNCFTLNMQGGSPVGYGSSKCKNPAYNADGSLIETYLQRLNRILKKADELNMVVILGLFYFGQDQYLTDEKAVICAVDNMIDWLLKKGYRNVMIEIANETNYKSYDHEILKPQRIHELIERVKSKSRHGHRLYAGTSFAGKVVPASNVVKASDFLLIHGNGASRPDQISELIKKTRAVEGYRPLPLINNEDDHFDFDKEENNFIVSIKNYCSWGYFDYRLKGETDYREGFQSVPVDWGVNSDRKKAFFNLVKTITGTK